MRSISDTVIPPLTYSTITKNAFAVRNIKISIDSADGNIDILYVLTLGMARTFDGTINISVFCFQTEK